MKFDIVKLQEKWNSKAKLYVDDKSRIPELIGKAKLKSKANKNSISEIVENLTLVLSLIKDWASGVYTSIPTGSIIGIIGAVVYFVSPIDAILDFLPSGLIDDALVLSLVFRQFQSDLSQYRTFKQQSSSSTEDD